MTAITLDHLELFRDEILEKFAEINKRISQQNVILEKINGIEEKIVQQERSTSLIINTLSKELNTSVKCLTADFNAKQKQGLDNDPAIEQSAEAISENLITNEISARDIQDDRLSDQRVQIKFSIPANQTQTQQSTDYQRRSTTNVTGNKTPRKLPQCPICTKVFTQNHSLKVHLRMHSGERPYPCRVCGKQFTQKGGLTTHMMSHTGEKPIKCDLCDKRFLSGSRLRVHMRIHTGEKPYSCDICGRTFSQKTSLSRHTLIHTGVSPFSCSICGMEFKENYFCKKHMRRCANKTKIADSNKAGARETPHHHHPAFLAIETSKEAPDHHHPAALSVETSKETPHHHHPASLAQETSKETPHHPAALAGNNDTKEAPKEAIVDMDVTQETKHSGHQEIKQERPLPEPSVSE